MGKRCHGLVYVYLFIFFTPPSCIWSGSVQYIRDIPTKRGSDGFLYSMNCTRPKDNRSILSCTVHYIEELQNNYTIGRIHPAKNFSLFIRIRVDAGISIENSCTTDSDGTCMFDISRQLANSGILDSNKSLCVGIKGISFINAKGQWTYEWANDCYILNTVSGYTDFARQLVEEEIKNVLSDRKGEFACWNWIKNHVQAFKTNNTPSSTGDILLCSAMEAEELIKKAIDVNDPAKAENILVEMKTLPDLAPLNVKPNIYTRIANISLFLSKLALERGDFQKSLDLAKACIEISHENDNVLCKSQYEIARSKIINDLEEAARSLMRQNKFREAIKSTEECLAFDNNNETCKVIKSDLEKIVVKIDQQEADTMFQKAMKAFYRNDFNEAKLFLRECLKILPLMKSCNNQMAIINNIENTRAKKAIEENEKRDADQLVDVAIRFKEAKIRYERLGYEIEYNTTSDQINKKMDELRNFVEKELKPIAYEFQLLASKYINKYGGKALIDLSIRNNFRDLFGD